MTLCLADTAEEDEWLDEWPLPGRPGYMLSPAYGLVHRELERYVQGEVPGRSFLIAGHRGAGKTALVRRAVEDVSRAVLRDGRGARNAAASSRLLGLQRPLLVKLYGPSLLVPAAGTDDHNTAAHDALVQITIALYRALSTEIAEAYAIHASEAWPERSNALELAGQLVLELDQVPDPATLRTFWTRLGRLHSGVIWPQAIAESLETGGIVDQGMREIVAVATAAQAYRVCAGEVKDRQSRKDEAAREASIESRGGGDTPARGGTETKPVVHGIAAGAAGALTGLGLAAAHGAVAGAAAGAGATLLSLLALSWSSRRSLRSERSVEYTFIRDHSIQTLERDLPLMIERIRRAGLAPVFLVDELDKLDRPEDSIGELIKRLKHLTTDYGFFCFLTDRDYFEFVRRKLQNEAYPLEHTYFSDRLFVLPRPLQFVAYLRGLVQARNTTSDSDVAQHAWVRSMLARIVVHRSKLNMIDAVRGLAAHFEAADGDDLDVRSIAAPLKHRLAFAVQIAIELMLQSRDVLTRLGDDPMFAQLAVDTLYRISRAWDADEKTIDLRREALVGFLLQRLRQKPDSDPELDEKALGRAAGGVKIDLLVHLMEGLRDHLLDLRALKTAAAREWRLDAEDEPYRTQLLDAIPTDESDGTPYLLQATDDDGIYTFAYDVFGGLNLDADDQLIEEATRLFRLAEALEDATNNVGIDGFDPIASGLLPPTVPLNEIRSFWSTMSRVADKAETQADLSQALPAFRALFAAIEERRGALAAAVPFLVMLATDVDGPDGPSLGQIIARLPRIVDLPSICAASDPRAEFRAVLSDFDAAVPVTPIQQADAAAFHEWGTFLGREMNNRKQSRRWPRPPGPAWTRWRARIVAWLSGEAPAAVTYEDVLFAVCDLPPGNLFRRDLGRMTVREWSAVVLSGLGQIERPWVAALALRALGFGHDVLASVAAGQATEAELGTDAGQQGVLLVCLESDSVADDTEYRPEFPVLAVTEAERVRFARELDMLTEFGAFGARANERETGETAD
jgi:hypothetical protein